MGRLSKSAVVGPRTEVDAMTRDLIPGTSTWVAGVWSSMWLPLSGDEVPLLEVLVERSA